jgi:cob(I)alamin adenosyltransferase
MRRGLVIVFTGDGKGKTSAALGVALRASGHGMRVSIVHFIKSPDVSGEERAAARLKPELEILALGRGFVNMGNSTVLFEEHRRAVGQAFDAASQRVRSGYWDIVVLDEINVAVSLGLIDVGPVIDLVRAKPAHQHLILTGRDVHPDLVEIADLVTEMRDIKHPYGAGIAAQQGIDY